MKRVWNLTVELAKEWWTQFRSPRRTRETFRDSDCFVGIYVRAVVKCPCGDTNYYRIDSLQGTVQCERCHRILAIRSLEYLRTAPNRPGKILDATLGYVFERALVRDDKQPGGFAIRKPTTPPNRTLTH